MPVCLPSLLVCVLKISLSAAIPIEMGLKIGANGEKRSPFLSNLLQIRGNICCSLPASPPCVGKKKKTLAKEWRKITNVHWEEQRHNSKFNKSKIKIWQIKSKIATPENPRI